MKTFYIHTLGCPKNVVDSESLCVTLERAGLKRVYEISSADLLLINTCGFIKEAKEESIEEILTIASEKKKQQKLIVLGCLSERYRDILRQELPEVDAFFGVESETEILSYLNKKTSSQRILVKPDTFPYGYIKVSEGCNRSCSFCAIPSIRGKYRSTPPEEVLKRAEALLKMGIKELILVAQDITSYGMEFKGYSLPELLQDLCMFDRDYWVRILYLYPTSISDRLIRVIDENKKICRYLDIPLQHSVERILHLMQRRGSSRYYLDLIKRLRKELPGVVLRTSIIVGFPTESEEEFESLLDFVRVAEFENLGTFVYSKEEGTVAAGMKGQLPESIKRERYHRLMSLQAEISARKNRALKGRILEVLIDEIEEDLAVGRYYGQAPEIDGVVIIERIDRLKRGEFVKVLIKETDIYDLRGEVV
jgi:ribosomal protein S12 methylthiotransferase